SAAAVPGQANRSPPPVNAPSRGGVTMIAFHVSTASLALIVGALVFLLPKGTELHRKIGYGYVGLMSLSSVSAFFLHGFNGGWSFFHVLAVWTLLTLVLGLLAI